MQTASPDLTGARSVTVVADGIPWATFEWGNRNDPAVVLIHGITSNANTFWRIGPAIASMGRRVVALDMPGHGRTGSWQGRYRLAETSADVAGFVQAAGLARSDLAVVGHSWGARVAAGLPAAGIRPDRLVLVDPPAIPLAEISKMVDDPLEHPYPSVGSAEAAIRATDVPWSDGDIHAKALALTQFDQQAFLGVILENGDWDGGLGVLEDVAARDVSIWLIRGEYRSGGMIPDHFVPMFEVRIGADHVTTIPDGPHSPQRTHPEATLLAILHALGLA